tara:strand:- start:16158 stop:16952 length:795 start_codon:yes stop_codon:yes gene_type:complete
MIECINRKIQEREPKHNMNTMATNFAKGCGGKIMSWEEAKKTDNTKMIWGAGMISAVKQCWERNIDFYYIDNGYLGMNTSKKLWFRIIKNHSHDIRPIILRPANRLDRIRNITIKPRVKQGSRIIIAPPSPKSFGLFDIDQTAWIDNTIKNLRQYTDRPYDIRLKRNRQERIKEDTLEEDLANDCHCLITYNSVAAVESVMNGVPAITLGPNAANHVSSRKLSEVNDLHFPTDQERIEWLRHLSYSQFTHGEMKDGTAMDILCN